jgi:NodT family efflux transporter outer membrane factor (OMF) lipoprotein
MTRTPASFARRAAGVAAVALLAGCTVGPDFERPSAPDTTNYTPGGTQDLSSPGSHEAQQRLAVGVKVTGEWWDMFHSPRLSEVLKEALANNQTLATARSTLAAAREQYSQAQGAFFPQVDFAASATRQRSSLLSLGINQLGPIDNVYSIGPNVSYALDIFGLNRRRAEQQDAIAQYQDYQLDGAYLTLTGNAVRQAIAIALARAQIAAVDSIIRDDEQTLDLVRREFQVRNKTVADVEAARTQLATDRALLPPLRQQLSVANDALAILAGKAPGDWSPPAFELAEFSLPQDLPLTVPSALVRQRPDILASEAQLHAASAAVGVATAQLYPNITLSASLTQEALKTATLFTSAGMAWSIAGGLTAPIFHGGALEAQKRGAEDNFQSAFATYRQTVLQSFGQVADTLQALDHDAQLLAAEEEALASSQAALKAARESYSFGQVEILRVIDAERQYAQAQLADLRAAAQRYLDTTDLFGAMGGGWQDWRAQQAANLPR